MMNRTQAIELLLKKPVLFAHLVGFNKLNSLHNKWIREMICNQDDATLQAHRGSYKTTCVSVALAIICILFPNQRTMFMRKTDDDVKEVIKQVAKILKDAHTGYITQVIYGISIKLTTESATEISTNLTTDIRGTSQLCGFGIGSSLTGKHFDRIFTDDIVNIKDRVSKAERDRTKLIYQELQNIKNRNGRIFNTGTTWHKDDAFAIMPPAERYDCYSTGLISAEELQKIKSRMIPSLFAANYELRHIPSDDVIFTDVETNAEPALVEQGICHIDAAYGGQDYTAFTIARKFDGKMYVYGRLWRKHVDDVIDEIIELRKSFNAGKIYCEDNGDKGYLAKDLRGKGERVVVYHEKMNKFIKITTYLKEIWSNTAFVAGTDTAYIEQICDYTEDAEHDDAPDSAACVARILYTKKGRGVDDYTPLWN